jgi:hypothetical protein
VVALKWCGSDEERRRLKLGAGAEEGERDGGSPPFIGAGGRWGDGGRAVTTGVKEA